MAVCPAGEETEAVFAEDRKEYINKIVSPLKSKPEPAYVIAGTRADLRR